MDRYHIIVGSSPADSLWDEMYIPYASLSLGVYSSFEAFLPYGKRSEDGPDQKGPSPLLSRHTGGASPTPG